MIPGIGQVDAALLLPGTWNGNLSWLGADGRMPGRRITNERTFMI
jgi:hypothetical protein